MVSILHEHAALKKRKVKIVPGAPWFDGKYENLEKRRRKAEKQYNKSRLLLHSSL